MAASGGHAVSGAEHGAVVAAMDSASADWEASANVQLVHDPSQDGACDAFNPNVTFDVGRI